MAERKEGFGLSNGNNSKSLLEILDGETLKKLKQDTKEEVENIENTEDLAKLMWKFVLLCFLTKNTKCFNLKKAKRGLIFRKDLMQGF